MAADKDTPFTVGQRVCVIGVGMDYIAHRHGVVERFTKKQIVVKPDRGESVDRFTIAWPYGSVPYSPYGGTQLYPRCQRPKKAS